MIFALFLLFILGLLIGVKIGIGYKIKNTKK